MPSSMVGSCQVVTCITGCTLDFHLSQRPTVGICRHSRPSTRLRTECSPFLKNGGWLRRNYIYIYTRLIQLWVRARWRDGSRKQQTPSLLIACYLLLLGPGLGHHKHLWISLDWGETFSLLWIDPSLHHDEGRMLRWLMLLVWGLGLGMLCFPNPGHGRSERHGDRSNGGHPEKISGDIDDLSARVPCCPAWDLCWNQFSQFQSCGWPSGLNCFEARAYFILQLEGSWAEEKNIFSQKAALDFLAAKIKVKPGQRTLETVVWVTYMIILRQGALW